MESSKNRVPCANMKTKQIAYKRRSLITCCTLERIQTTTFMRCQNCFALQFLQITFNFPLQNFDFAAQTAIRYRMNSFLRVYFATEEIDFSQATSKHRIGSVKFIICTAYFLPFCTWLRTSQQLDYRNNFTLFSSRHLICIFPVHMYLKYHRTGGNIRCL